MVDVSVIMPVYNVERYIRASLESVINQTHQNIEIILVDDGSTDASGVICDRFAASDDRIKVIHKQNEGTGYARNTGMDAAAGEYVYFCDPDDVLDPALIADNIDIAHQTNADIVVFGYRKIYLDGEGKETKRDMDFVSAVSGAYSRRAFAQQFRTCFRGQHTLWTKFFRRQLLVQNHIRSGNQRVGQDVVFLLDIFSSPFETVYFHQKAYYNYFLHPRSATTVYNPARFECEFDTARKKEALIDSFGQYGIRYDDIVLKSYLESTNMAFGAFSLWDAPPELDRDARMGVLNAIFSRKEMIRAVKTAKYSLYAKLTGKCKLFLFKHRMYRTIVFLSKMIGKKYRGTL